MSVQNDSGVAATTAMPLGGTGRRWAVMALLTAAALWLGWKAWDVNITLACWKDEWPHLKVCEEINGRTPAERWLRLQERLVENPGDSQALVALMVLAHAEGMGSTQERDALLNRAIKAAPQNPDVLQRQAVRALDAGRWPEALSALTRLSRYHRQPAASQTLAQLVVQAHEAPALQEALKTAVRDDMGWLDGVLRAMPGLKLPVADAWWLLAEGMASHRLEPKLGQWVMGRLKTEGQWTEAQWVWLHLWQRPMPLLFNGDFERDFVAHGFDWEVAGRNDHRAGAKLELVNRPDRGRVLRVAFAGKAFNTPLVSQHLVLPPGLYRLQGRWQSNDLRSEHGLSWVIHCLGGPGGQRDELTRAPAMKSSGREWKSWQIELNVPGTGCGPGLQLALQPFAGYEARAGMQGEILLDDLRLETVGH